MLEDELCKAIKERRVLEFEYEGDHCSMCPYVLYRQGEDARVLLDGFQGKPSRRRRKYLVSNIRELKVTNEPFLPDVTFDTRSSEYQDLICPEEEP